MKSIFKRLQKANPDRNRFRVAEPSSTPGFADIVDYQTGLSYTVFRASDISSREGWAVLPDGLDTEDAWVYPSQGKLAKYVWDEIIVDAKYLVEEYEEGY